MKKPKSVPKPASHLFVLPLFTALALIALLHIGLAVSQLQQPAFGADMDFGPAAQLFLSIIGFMLSLAGIVAAVHAERQS